MPLLPVAHLRTACVCCVLAAHGLAASATAAAQGALCCFPLLWWLRLPLTVSVSALSLQVSALLQKLKKPIAHEQDSSWEKLRFVFTRFWHVLMSWPCTLRLLMVTDVSPCVGRSASLTNLRMKLAEKEKVNNMCPHE